MEDRIGCWDRQVQLFKLMVSSHKNGPDCEVGKKVVEDERNR